ncbi:sodium:proton antiporter [Bifidobacterium margollesii]|uniref:Sodium:proton antiporter n=2 Tax=Bifidobacterium margollesii TaxID=2020964 RepID=A0A2N5J719_9BIFI|nr:sodium:proton antiporter [Bifidobacterium margollesii]
MRTTRHSYGNQRSPIIHLCALDESTSIGNHPLGKLGSVVPVREKIGIIFYMASLTLVIQVLIAVLISSALSNFIPRISTPLVQILLGVAWYFTPFLPNLEMDSELFMVLFIAPLLFLEARNVPRREIAANLVPSMSLAVGLVLLSLATTGVTLHVLWPAVPLAAAFALGAALGPTDAVAVSALSKEAKLSERQLHVLRGESLFNDAASIVGFQFACAAALTGTFSALDFTEGILFSFCGGVAIGFIVGFLFNNLVLWLRRYRMETMTLRIGIEVLIPFAAYVAAEHFHVSGVLSVVAAGLTITFHRYGFGSDIARTNLVSNSVWQFIEFALNGSVFVLLGIELPLAMRASWENESVSTGMLLLAIGVITVVSLALRFVWISAMLRLTHDRRTGKRRRMTAERWRSAVVMTFGGPKGTISLALAFTLPYSIDVFTHIPLRNALLFIVSGYIVVSLVLANVMLPLLAPKDDDSAGEEYAKDSVEMLRRTLTKIAELDTPETHAEVRAVMHSYTERIDRVKRAVPQETMKRENKVRVSTLEWERKWLNDYVKEHPEHEDAANALLDRLSNSLNHLTGSGGHHIQIRQANPRRQALIIVRRVWGLIARMTPGLDPGKVNDMRGIQIELFKATIGHLKQEVLTDVDNAEIIARLIGEYRAALTTLHTQTSTLMRPKLPSLQGVDDIRTQTFRLELETIREMLEEDEITRPQAKLMRQNVYLMQADAVL